MNHWLFLKFVKIVFAPNTNHKSIGKNFVCLIDHNCSIAQTTGLIACILSQGKVLWHLFSSPVSLVFLCILINTMEYQLLCMRFNSRHMALIKCVTWPEKIGLICKTHFIDRYYGYASGLPVCSHRQNSY